MKLKTLIPSALTVSAFAAVLVFVGGSAGAAGNTFVVDDDGMATSGNCNSSTVTPYITISSAVTAAAAGDTIKVCPGTYPESVLVNKALNIRGAKAGSNVSGRTFNAANESTVDGATAGAAAFTVSAADVTINGFSVTNPGEGLGIIVQTAGNNAVIKNNIVDGVGSPTFPNHTVGIYLETGPDNVKVWRNRINNVQSNNPAGTPGTAQGVLVGDSLSNNPSLNTRIDDNTISNITSSTRGAYGIQVNNGSGAGTGYAEVKIRGNNISNLTGNWAHAIGLEGETPNAEVKHNTIANLTDSNPTPFADVIGVFFQANPFFFTANVNRNSLAVGNGAFGIAVDPALTSVYISLSVDGECNWWGASTGPGAGLGSVGTGLGSLVSTGVDYSPWLKSANLNKGCGDKNHHDNDHHHGDWGDDDHNWRKDHKDD